ncbi:MAG TPA: acyl-CoA dehydrogenase family protein, partial [Caulobacteraceae bacterium]|nr:acyl-CoA dehydrogenase family protein [Caulobacteraceae bacterium]
GPPPPAGEEKEARMADFGGELDTFRTEARTWLEQNFPASLRRSPEAPADPEAEAKPSADAELWRKRIGEKGWGTPTWPTEYGGGGLTPAEARILRDEMERIGAPNPIGGMGVGMFGPTLLEYGNEAQLQRHIPPIVKGELRWCQGFSEPGAGSDLASLQTRAEDMGDHFLVNGQKIWTSGAHLADWCFCLVRTDPKAKKHEGISFLLIDMKTPGVEPRPIRLINDTTPFCETFFTNVKAPKENLVGPLNGGWTIAKRLLQFERQGIGSPARAGQAGPGALSGPPIHELAKTYIGVDDAGRLSDADLRARITSHLMDSKAHALTGERIALEAKSNRGPSATSSIMKNAGTVLRKEKAELAVEILGHQGVGWGGDGFTEHETSTMRIMLRSKSGTIAGGSQEVQNNIIAKRILGLPDTTHST